MLRACGWLLAMRIAQPRVVAPCARACGLHGGKAVAARSSDRMAQHAMASTAPTLEQVANAQSSSCSPGGPHAEEAWRLVQPQYVLRCQSSQRRRRRQNVCAESPGGMTGCVCGVLAGCGHGCTRCHAAPYGGSWAGLGCRGVHCPAPHHISSSPRQRVCGRAQGKAPRSARTEARWHGTAGTRTRVAGVGAQRLAPAAG